jgi:hypothetical protein
MNSLWDIRILLGLVPKESPYTTAVELSLGGSSPYTNTEKTNKNKYTQTKQYKNTVQTVQSTVNASTHITKTHTQLSKHPTHYKRI